MTLGLTHVGGEEWMSEINAALDLINAASLTLPAASSGETITGTSTTKAVTPASLMAALAALAFPIAMPAGKNTFLMGTVSSANDTSGVHLDGTTVTKAHGVAADTGGVALASGFVRASSSRLLIGTAISGAPNVSAAGIEGLLKFIVSANMGGNVGGVMGHLESEGTLTLTGSINVVKAAVAAFLDLAAGATVAASTVVSAFGVNPANFGTLTGRSAIVHVTAPVAGYWGSLFDISGLNGLATSAVGAIQDLHGVIYYNGVKYTFPLYRA